MESRAAADVSDSSFFFPLGTNGAAFAAAAGVNGADAATRGFFGAADGSTPLPDALSHPLGLLPLGLGFEVFAV